MLSCQSCIASWSDKASRIRANKQLYLALMGLGSRRIRLAVLRCEEPLQKPQFACRFCLISAMLVSRLHGALLVGALGFRCFDT